jgi:2-polyprenyl-6-methoxyphenol hydroxylase-like FAD-dependent oxidoreductase
MQQSHIAIICAGPGGLTLARLLQLQNIPCTIYERDASPSARTEGGSLDLQTESGQRALEAAGLIEQFNKIARYQGQDFKLLDKDGKIHIEHVSTETERDRPEIDREVLRRLLLDSINSDFVHWDHKLRLVSGPREDGRFQLQFDERDDVAVADMVVGADGAWSVVRKLVSDAVPAYSTCTMIEVRFRDVDNRHPKISRLVGNGSLGAYSHERALMAQRNGDGSIWIYICLRVPQSWASDCGVDFNSPQATKDELMKHFVEWDDGLKDLIKQCDDEGIFVRPLYALPIGHNWALKHNITLIGDAAHLMTPFAGQGVNLAMLDALLLCEAIAGNKDNLKAAIGEYEAEMVERVKIWAQHSANNLELILAEDAPKGFADLVRQYMPNV